MSSTSEDWARSILKAHDQVKGALRLLTDEVGSTYRVTGVLNSFLDIFDRFCPYKVGDRVRLTKSFVADTEDHGWKAHQHFLQKGSTAVVVERSYNPETHCFVFLINPEYQSWISGIDGKENVLSAGEHGYFHFSETWLTKA